MPLTDLSSSVVKIIIGAVVTLIIIPVMIYVVHRSLLVDDLYQQMQSISSIEQHLRELSNKVVYEEDMNRIMNETSPYMKALPELREDRAKFVAELAALAVEVAANRVEVRSSIDELKKVNAELNSIWIAIVQVQEHLDREESRQFKKKRGSRADTLEKN